MKTPISIHLSNCQRTKYLYVCDDFSLTLSCPYILYIYMWLPSSTSLEKEKREIEKINVNNQMVVYEFIWYIPFEDWSFDDIIYTLVGSIVSFSLYVSKHYT
jgi:hypothetical protein